MILESGGFIMVNNVAVKVSNLSKEFLLGQDKTVSILKDVSLSVNYGEFLSTLFPESLRGSVTFSSTGRAGTRL